MKHRIRRPAALVAAVAAALVVVAVAAGFSTSPSSSDKLSKGTISIGYGNNLTGFLAVHDKLISNGAKLAVAQINAKGGIGGKVKIKMDLQDTKSDPSASVQVANYFINKHVNVMVLPCNTDYQVAMAAVAHRAHQLMLSPCNADPTVGIRTPEYWALGMAGNAQMAQLANYARLRKLKRVYVLDSNFLYLHLMAKYFKKAAPSRGLSIIGTDNIPFGATGFPSDYAAQVQKIKNVHPAPQAIMTGLFSPFVDTFAKQLRAAGLKMPILGSDGMDTALDLTAGGAAVNGNGFTTFGYPNRGSATARFYAQFRRKFGASPDGSYPALGYDAIKTIEAAVLKAQSTKPSKLAAAFRTGLTIRGALGVSRFLGHGNHNAVAPVVVDQIKNGHFVLVMKNVPKHVPAP
jgi:branched-chain amino acid transport system substrate-binding protein